MIDFDKKLALVGIMTGLIGVILSPIISLIVAKDAISSQLELQKANSTLELDKIKLEKTIQIKNDAYAELLLGFTQLSEAVFFADYRPTKDAQANFIKTFFLQQQNYRDKIYLAYFKLYPLIKSQKAKQDSENLVKKILAEYSNAGAMTLKPGMNMDFEQLDLIAKQCLPEIQHDMALLKEILNEELK